MNKDTIEKRVYDIAEGRAALQEADETIIKIIEMKKQYTEQAGQLAVQDDIINSYMKFVKVLCLEDVYKKMCETGAIEMDEVQKAIDNIICTECQQNGGGIGKKKKAPSDEPVFRGGDCYDCPACYKCVNCECECSEESSDDDD